MDTERRPQTAYEVGVKFYTERIAEMRQKFETATNDWDRLGAADEGELAELKLRQLERRESYMNEAKNNQGSGEYDITDPQVTRHFKELGS